MLKITTVVFEYLSLRSINMFVIQNVLSSNKQFGFKVLHNILFPTWVRWFIFKKKMYNPIKVLKRNKNSVFCDIIRYVWISRELGSSHHSRTFCTKRNENSTMSEDMSGILDDTQTINF